MFTITGLDPAFANAAYVDFRNSATWLFDDASEETLTSRRLALASIEDLHPTTAFETRLAVQIVANDVHAADCLRLAAEHRDDDKEAARCRRQANAMQRQSARSLQTLEQIQQRQRMRTLTEVEMANVCRSWAQGSRITAAPSLGDMPATQGAPTAELPRMATDQPPDIADQSIENNVTSSPVQPDTPLARSVPAAVLAKAESFATTQRLLATRIRRAGGVTRQATAGFRPSIVPSDAAVIRALVYGTSPILQALDGGNHKAS